MERTRFIFSVGRLILILLMFTASACEKWIVVPSPKTEISRDDVFKDDATATAALIDIYGQLYLGFAKGDISVIEAVYGDELLSHAPISSTQQFLPFYLNSVVPSNAITSTIWQSSYRMIYSTNLIIEGVNVSSTISNDVKAQLTGEALFLRAFCHFVLTNLFGDVPYVTTTDYRINSSIAKTLSAEVLEKIINDLVEAKRLLSETYPSAGRVRANRDVASALLARAYLYAKKYDQAENEATELINKTDRFQLQTDLNLVFLNASEEAIWQLPPSQERYTYEGFTLIIVAAPPGNVSLRDELYVAFENDDLRKSNWIGTITSTSGLTTWHYPYKYKENHLNPAGQEHSMVLRLAEQYLIRAESRAELNKLTGSNSAEMDLNIVRSRAGLPNTSAITKEQLLSAIEHERRVELFTEWGHRFFDLRRTGRADAVLGASKPNWLPYKALLPIPQTEILSNLKLKQNTGY